MSLSTETLFVVIAAIKLPVEDDLFICVGLTNFGDPDVNIIFDTHKKKSKNMNILRII
jgi:hypothetical protein